MHSRLGCLELLSWFVEQRMHHGGHNAAWRILKLNKVNGSLQMGFEDVTCSS